MEEIAEREFGQKALKPLEVFQNRILIEKDAISKLLHRIRNKMININRVSYEESIDGRMRNEQNTLRDDMKNYIKLHYELKEEMMDYFLEWL